MSVLESVLDKLENATNFPVLLTNKEFSIINESYVIANALEDYGYKVETFSNPETGIYGFKVDR